jgi:hypothetical protein
VATAEFAELWFDRSPPRAAYDARSQTEYGSLLITDDAISFRSSSNPTILEPLRDVAYGRFGSDFFNRWIRVTFGSESNPVVCYIKDGGWRGWRPILTRSNRPILDALRRRLKPH